MRLILLIVVICFVGCTNDSNPKANAKDKIDWTLLPFVKADEVNPILVPDTNAIFNCPIIGKVKCLLMGVSAGSRSRHRRFRAEPRDPQSIGMPAEATTRQML